MKQVAPEPEIPSRPIPVTNGAWTCIPCGQELGAIQSQVNGYWQLNLPADCPHDETCARRCGVLLNAMHDPDAPAIPNQ